MEKVYELMSSEIVHTHTLHFTYDTEEEYTTHRRQLEIEGYEIGRLARGYNGLYAKAYYCKETYESM